MLTDKLALLRSLYEKDGVLRIPWGVASDPALLALISAGHLSPLDEPECADDHIVYRINERKLSKQLQSDLRSNGAS